MGNSHLVYLMGADWLSTNTICKDLHCDPDETIKEKMGRGLMTLFLLLRTNNLDYNEDTLKGEYYEIGEN